MKNVILSFLLIAAVSAGLLMQPELVQAESSSQVIAYYFHGSVRCPTCQKLEQYSKEAIETNFKDSLDSGSLIFKVVNIEDKGNEHFASDYQLYTKSLVLSYTKNGQETKSKNLTKIWELVGNKQKFHAYVTSEIHDFLKGV